ncbi:MAG: iron-containing alcohol dehydrogenase [Candidatus Thorarchaeota archaeon]
MTSNAPESIIIEEGAIDRLDHILSEHQRPLFVTDVVLYDKYKRMIEDTVKLDVVWAISPDHQKGIVGLYPNVDIIVGFGGGRSIDIAKIISMEANLDWISIPTAASHDGIGSDVASVMQNGYRYSEKCKSPKIILADLSIIATAPKILTLSGIGDIISKTSSLAEWKLAKDHGNEKFDADVYATVEKSLNNVLKDDGLETLVQSLIDTGNAMTAFGSSRPCSGTEHAISHAMDRRIPSLHGLQVAFATPLCLYFLEQVGFSKYTGKDIRDFLVDRNMPVTLKELDMNEDMFLDDIKHALEIMKRRGRYSILSHCQNDDNDLKVIFREIGY